MSGEASYFSRFFVKFVEIIAAGFASAISAYLLAHFGGLLSSPTPASTAPALTAVQVGPNTNGVTSQPTAPVAAIAVNERAAQQQGAPETKLTPKAGKDTKVLPPRKYTKTDTDVAEKEPRSQKSAEALVRAALANVDAKASTDAVIGPGTPDTPSASVDALPGQSKVLTRQADVEPRPVAAIDPLLPGASPPIEQAAPQAPPPADQDKQVRAGVLTCDVSASMGLILGSQKLLACAFALEGSGSREHYDGSITKFGIDVGVTRGGVMVWAVFTNTVAGPGLLAGDYFGASAEVTMAAGLGANVLVGGSNRTVALQPISVSGQTGLNLAIGVAALRLGLPRQ